MPGSNKGGTVEAGGVRITLVNAFHSSASDDGDYLGEAAGLIVSRLGTGCRRSTSRATPASSATWR